MTDRAEFEWEFEEARRKQSSGHPPGELEALRALAKVGADLVREEPAGLTEEETIISMAGLILKWCEMNYCGKHPGHKPIKALAKRLYRRAVNRGLA